MKYLKLVKFGFIYLIFEINAFSNLAFLVKKTLAAFENVMEIKADIAMHLFSSKTFRLKAFLQPSCHGTGILTNRCCKQECQLLMPHSIVTNRPQNLF